ncbi:MAG: hypothetical protein BZ151_04695 [Desulfobacca sp. 4484_104]|nr:MAG: hypothetical protein BZ151_04695 [Desulfobacca sp. 4484_104]
MSEKIGLIAGRSQFPLLFAQAARQKGLEVVAVAHHGETDPALAHLVHRLEWVYVGQLGRIIRCFKNAGVRQAVLAGGIRKGRLFTQLRPDWRALKLIRRVERARDDGILRAVADELESAGITIVPSTLYLDELLAPAGVLSRRQPSPEELRDIDYGFKIAKEIGRLDIGQCVVVRRQAVLALEAIEGTDETIRRGGRLAGEQAVVVKVSKPGQDLRFDVPAVGLDTVKIMVEVKATVLAVEAGKTLIFDRQAMLAAANHARLVVLGVSEQATDS